MAESGSSNDVIWNLIGLLGLIGLIGLLPQHEEDSYHPSSFDECTRKRRHSMRLSNALILAGALVGCRPRCRSRQCGSAGKYCRHRQR